MKTVHPYIRRIRTEREVLALINTHKTYFGAELNGLSIDAIERWFEKTPADIKTSKSTLRIKAELISIGTLTKLSSNGSHRGAMIAPPPNAEIAAQLITDLETMLASHIDQQRRL